VMSARGADALITSAGISMGERDLVRGVLGEIGGKIDFWRVKMKPGSPFAFGRVDGLGGIPWFGLPGNPVSSMVTFEVLVRPALLRMMGRPAIFAPTVTAAVAGRVAASDGLTDFLRVRLTASRDGYAASATGAQGSGILTSMAAADGLLVVPEACGDVQPGERLPVLVLGGAPLREAAGF
jgi:molybdopterin molybdotransferase